jgi:chemotaxis protein CheZ
MGAMEAVETRQQKIQLARRLIEALERGDEPGADAVLDDLTADRDNLLFQEVGRLTRELHEAINGFLVDNRIKELAETDIPDATHRLHHVITMTERAANATLSAVEAGLPLADELRDRAGRVAEPWTRFRQAGLGCNDDGSLGEEVDALLDLANRNGQALHRYLSDILMAQDFQDLTGQIIRKVIDLVHDVEDKLVQLVRLSGRKLQKSDEGPLRTRIESGPVVPGVDQGDVVKGQDDVDDLLSSLGF